MLQSSEIELIGFLVVDSFDNNSHSFLHYFLQNAIHNILPDIFLKQLIGYFLIQWLKQLKFLNPFINDEQFPSVQSLFVDGLGAYTFELLIHWLDESFVKEQFKGIPQVEPESYLRTIEKQPALDQAFLNDGLELLFKDTGDYAVINEVLQDLLTALVQLVHLLVVVILGKCYRLHYYSTDLPVDHVGLDKR